MSRHAELTFEELQAWLRERGASLRCTAQGPTFYVHIAVSPILQPVVVENPDMEIAIRAAMRIVDGRLEARGAAAEFQS